MHFQQNCIQYLFQKIITTINATKYGLLISISSKLKCGIVEEKQ